MAAESSVVFPKLRCAPFHSALEADPIGSGASYDAYLCVEIPLPWKRDISGNEPFRALFEEAKSMSARPFESGSGLKPGSIRLGPATSGSGSGSAAIRPGSATSGSGSGSGSVNPVPAKSGPAKAGSAFVSGADGRKWRPQGLVPSEGRDGLVQVIAFEQPGRGRTGMSGASFDRREWLVPTDRVFELCLALLRSDDEALDGLAADEVATSASASAEGRGPVELFVCTHGQRDICCGGSGTVLHTQLVDLLDLEADMPAGARASGYELSVRRVSHTGGHRFAPTALTFPDGYAWSHLDARLALGVARRSIEVSEVMGHVRGSTLFKGGPAQMADRYGLGVVGWDWLDAHRSVELIGFDRRTMATDVRVNAEMPNGEEHCFELRVGIERHIPQITCGAIDSPEYKVEPVWRVEEARSL
ncbi:MAG TPA: sucrase ferredoxin [Microthrixaceae bacterium]|nr:sucrase ferredoxin [Microthrixaceae bacterium]